MNDNALYEYIHQNGIAEFYLVKNLVRKLFF